MLQMLEISDKDFKAAIKMLQWAITNTFETNEVLVSKIKDTKQKMTILELKNKILVTEINLLHGSNRRMEMTGKS